MKSVEGIQATLEELKEKQERLKEELEQIRVLQPKVGGGVVFGGDY